MSLSTTWRVGATFAASALLLSGCGMFGGTEEARGESFAEVFGYAADDADWAALNVSSEELVAACMHDLGWEYIAVVYPDEYYDSWVVDPAAERARLAEEGLGVSHGVLYGDSNDDLADSLQYTFTDPNDAYRESLSQDELDRYYTDLHANFDSAEPADSSEYRPTDRGGWGGGCQGRANAEVYGGLRSGYVADHIGPFTLAIHAQVRADPRITDQRSRWVACMSEAGYEFRDQEDFWESGLEQMFERFYAIVGYDFDYGDVTETERGQLELLLQDEITLALAEHDCSDGHSERYMEVYAELESEFIRDNRAAIDEVLAQLQ